MGSEMCIRDRLITISESECGMRHWSMPWFIQHSAWIINRYQVHADGHTSYKRRFSVDHNPSICQFAELIYFKASDAHTTYKASSSWSSGIWVGLASESCSHLIVNPSGAYKTRSIRRRPSEEQFQIAIFSSQCSAVPWNLRGDGKVDQKFLIPDFSEYMRLIMKESPGSSSSSKTLALVKHSGRKYQGQFVREQTIGRKYWNIVRE